MDHLEVVDVASERQDLAVGERQREDAGVGVVELLEALRLKPREEVALEAAAGLLDAVDGFSMRATLGWPRASYSG